jgi:uncharacterized membrane protein
VASTILGVFDDPLAARRAVERLREGPLDLEDVSIVTRATESGAAVSNSSDVSAGEGAAVGAVWGGLIGLVSLLLPGVGPLIAFGALGAALTGAVTGAVVGGIAASLIDFGNIPADEAREYEQQINEGMTLVAVKARDEIAQEVRRVLANAGAESIRDNQTDVAEGSSGVRVATYDSAGARVDLAHEFGAPANPTTSSRQGDYAMPEIDRTANTFEPRVEPRPTLDDPVATGRAERVEPRHSGTYADDEHAQDVTRPETMGTPPSNRSDTGTHAGTPPAEPARAVGAPEPASDTPFSTGRAGQVQPRLSGEGIESMDEDELSTPDAPKIPRATGPDTNLPDPDDSTRRSM